MSKKRALIVGGVAGGASAAARLRRLDENIDIVMKKESTFLLQTVDYHIILVKLLKIEII